VLTEVLLATDHETYLAGIYSAMDGTSLVFAKIETRGPPMVVGRFACFNLGMMGIGNNDSSFSVTLPRERARIVS
jgi:hypothetical protein